MEELLTVAIDYTPNTLFRTGIARFFCNNSIVAFFYLFYIHEIVHVTEM